MKKFFIIDGHALCYRAYFAFIKNPLTNSKGQNISAVYGFAKMLLKLVKDQSPDYLAVAFDPKEKSFRFQMFDDYKANRQKMPDELRTQIEEIKNMLTTLEIPIIIQEGIEADDVMGSLSKKYASPQMQVVLVTGDKDAYQLINDNVIIYANSKGISEYLMIDEAAVVEKLGIKKSQVIDYYAMVGDTADNIPGIKGIGEKTAVKLLNDFGSLDNIYQNLDKLTAKQRELFETHRDEGLLSRELFTIRTDESLTFDINKAIFEGIDQSKAKNYFSEMEIRSIADEFSTEKNDTPALTANYITVNNIDQLDSLIAVLTASEKISVDTETTGVNPMEAEIVGMSFSVNEGEGWYIPVANASLFGGDFATLDKVEVLEKIKPILENETIRKIGQNIKYDYIIFFNEGITLKGIYFDTMIASYLINPNERRHNMDDMAMQYLNYKTMTYDELVGKGKNAIDIRQVDIETLTHYAAEDTDITLRLHNHLKPIIENNEHSKIMYDMEMPLLSVLADMEITGVKLDTVYLNSLKIENQKLIDTTAEEIYSTAGRRFNINSTKELSSLLFNELGLKTQKKTKTGFSTDITVLEELKGHHPVIEKLILYRTITKLQNTYIETLPTLINRKTGRIHTSYNQTVAATGRLSSSDPNLQNIPVKDDFGRKIRRAFIPEKGFKIMAADYSQIELRIAAAMCNDTAMKNAFINGIDIHTLTASSVFGVPLDDVTKDMRRQAKVINFSTIYGVSPYGLSQQVDISVSQAKIFIDKYFETYPGFKNYMEDTIKFAKKNTYVETLLGRKRPIVDINSDVSFRREGAERIAINTPIQGTSADMIKIAMINISQAMKSAQMKSRMIMQVHDELVFEAHICEMDELSSLVREKMENAITLDIPMIAEIKFGDNWEEAH